jgi:hypothetical protein
MDDSKFLEILNLAKENLVIDLFSWQLVVTVLLSLIGWWLIKFFVIRFYLLANLRTKLKFDLKLGPNLGLPTWWWFCLAYVGFFELALSFSYW